MNEAAAAPIEAPIADATPVVPAEKRTSSTGVPRGTDGKFTKPAVNGEQSSAPAPETEGTSEAAPPEPEYFELKINGKSERLTKEQVVMRAQKSEAADRMFREAAQRTKQVEEILSSFKTDPEATLVRLGIDPTPLLESVLARKARDATLTEEQRQVESAQKERDAYKAKVEAYEKEQKEAAQAKADEATTAQVEEKFLSAAQRHGLDRNAQTLELMCDIAIEAVQLGLEPNPDAICQEVLHRQRQFLADRDAKLIAKYKSDPAKLSEYLGQDVVDALTKATLKAVPGPGTRQSSSPKEAKEKVPPKGYLTPAEFERSLGLRK